MFMPMFDCCQKLWPEMIPFQWSAVTIEIHSWSDWWEQLSNAQPVVNERHAYITPSRIREHITQGVEGTEEVEDAGGVWWHSCCICVYLKNQCVCTCACCVSVPWYVWKSEGISEICSCLQLYWDKVSLVVPPPFAPPLSPLLLLLLLNLWVILLFLSPTLPYESQNYGCHCIFLFEWVPASELKCQAYVVSAFASGVISPAYERSRTPNSCGYLKKTCTNQACQCCRGRQMESWGPTSPENLQLVNSILIYTII